MYSVEIEEWKHALHNAYFFNDRRLIWSMGINPSYDVKTWIKTHENECREKYIQWYFETKLQSLQRLQSLQSLQTSYDQVEIQPDSIVYCDPPYQDTAQYITGNFDNTAFWNWCRQQTELVVVSEYAAPDDFECVAVFNRRSKLQGGTVAIGCKSERLFIHKNKLHIFNKQKLFNL